MSTPSSRSDSPVRVRSAGRAICRVVVLIGALVCVAVTSGRASAVVTGEQGLPLVRHYPPSVIGGGPQLIVGVEAQDGAMIFAANRSVLEFDGARWRRVGVPTPRQLAVDDQGRVWVGCDADFGYLERGEAMLRFVSLRDVLAEPERPSRRVRGIAHHRGVVSILYTDALVEVRTDETGFAATIERPGGTFEALTLVDGRPFVHQRGVGVHPWGEVVPTAGDAGYGEVNSLVSLGDGAFVLATQSGRLVRWRAGEVVSFSPQLEAVVAGHRLQSIRWRADGGLAVASRGNGLFLLDDSGSIEWVWDRARGLPHDDVFGMVEDGQGSMWLLTGDGLAQVVALPLGFYHHADDAPRTLVSGTRYEGALYIGGGDGAFRLRPAENGVSAHFVRVEGLAGMVGSWASTPLGLHAAGPDGVFRIDGQRAVERVGPGQRVAWSEEHGQAVVVDGGDLRRLEPTPDGWRATVHRAVLPDRVAEIVIGDAHDLWLVTMGSRVLLRVDLGEGWSGKPQVTSFDLAAPWPRPLRVDGELLFRVGDEVVRIVDGEGGGLVLERDPRFEISSWIEPGEDRYGIKALPSGELWLFARDRARRLVQRDDGTFAPGAPSLSLPARLNFDVLPDTRDEIFWLATDMGPVRFDPRFESPPPSPPRVRFLAPTERLRTPTEDGPVLTHAPGALRFEVGAPDFLEPGSTRYRYRLWGLDESWSAWTDEPVKEFTNLPGRWFRFEVEARQGDRALGSSAFAFEVSPPWYATWWARILGLLTLTAAVALFARAERRKTERAQEVSRQLRAVDKLKDEFLANTSHELRTPLFGITGLAESLLDRPESMSSEARESLAMIVASGNRLGTLVDDILDFSKLRNESLEIDPRPVDVGAAARLVLALSKPLVKGKRLELLDRVPEGLPAVHADENRLQQILHNLVGNAIKFTDSGQIEISAEAETAAEEVVIRVRDTGVGIAEADQERIFEAFERASTATSAALGGTGLGLAVSRQLVALHGGRIGVESRPYEGATFWFSLPIAPAGADSAGLARPVSPPLATAEDDEGGSPFEAGVVPGTAAQPVEGDVSTSGRVARILAVDDEPVNLQVLAGYLAGQPYELTLVSSGDEALEQLAHEHFDLVLLDVMMPRISGLDVCRTLRTRQDRAELPVIFLTAKNQPADIVTGIELGANDYLSKPISKSELLARVRPHLELARLNRQLRTSVEEKSEQLVVLSGLLPICSFCKKVRDDEGLWNELEAYLDRHSDAELTHGVCPDCIGREYPELGLDPVTLD